ncbi:carboxymuconolactone decarboxylase family protein [Iamia sp. SCSIO 61187]|uniref:carboxymuconolactone decarboxylase family protein n=1 Tax=Iamia sp. SCSIO 61187 TaxID=2722752 RepID=UPI001C631EC1|nr:carboxymuconolactone decarboxylase family protein [Iamia sp. SCSIO 61187]QYG94866.1 carboxymuconolactone decarboxylase family protein [Iamia sp. SCSIO 61187]
MTDAAPRITPGGRGDVGVLTWALSHAAGRAQGTGPPHLFLTLGRHRRLLRGWLRFASRLMPFGTLPRRETELVILRVAHLTGCTYEWEHHRHLGRRAGVTEADLARVEAGPSAPGLSERERALLAAVDSLHRDGDIDDAGWADLRRHLDERAAIELVLLAGHYEMLATFLRTLRVAPDERRPRRRRRG